MRTNEKAGTVATVTDLGNHSIAGGNQKAYFAFDYGKSETKKQEICNLCSPLPGKKISAGRTCAGCTEKSEILTATILTHVSRPRKIIRLQKCVGCGGCKTARQFSIYHAICKKCLSDARAKSKIAQSNFVERLLNNLRRNLKGVLHNA